MRHNIRINGEIKTVDCDVGTGVFDKHGKEIFDGDVIEIDFDKAIKHFELAPVDVKQMRPHKDIKDGKLTVDFFEGRFWLVWRKKGVEDYVTKDVSYLPPISKFIKIIGDNYETKNPRQT